MLVKAFDRPDYFGYSLNILADSPTALDELLAGLSRRHRRAHLHRFRNPPPARSP